MKERTERMGFSIDREIAKTARDMAHSSGKSLSQYVEDVLQEYLAIQIAPGEKYVRATINLSRLLYDVRDLLTVVINLIDVFVRFYVAEHRTVPEHSRHNPIGETGDIPRYMRELFSSSVGRGGTISDFRLLMQERLSPIEKRYQAYVAMREAEFKAESGEKDDTN